MCILLVLLQYHVLKPGWQSRDRVSYVGWMLGLGFLQSTARMNVLKVKFDKFNGKGNFSLQQIWVKKSTDITDGH